MPDWDKIKFHEHAAKSWDDLLPTASHEARDLVSKLVRYSGGQRLSAKLVRSFLIYPSRSVNCQKALEHQFFVDRYI
jgi:hypothetical protein